jgi:hypothetical protein
MNVEYEDVLQLYRGWRKSESALRDKDKELYAVKNRVNQLQDSHNRFRGQIQALESVKELTVSLQTQLTALQHENKQLLSDNKELANLNLKAEEILRDKKHDEQNQAKMSRNVQIEFATLKGRYEETLKAQKELERIAHQEQTSRLATEHRLATAEQTVKEIAHDNKSLRHELESSQHKLNQCDQELLHASEQLSSITKEIVSISTTKEALTNAEAEVNILKGDISRLIALFDHLPGGKEFFYHWQDSQRMSFVGTEDAEPFIETDYHPERSSFIVSSYDGGAITDMAATEFAHLKRVRGKDPFPLSAKYLYVYIGIYDSRYLGICLLYTVSCVDTQTCRFTISVMFTLAAANI